MLRHKISGRGPLAGDNAVALGVTALGVCLFVHALGFVPYQRLPVLKWTLVVAGVTVFFLGLFGTEL